MEQNDSFSVHTLPRESMITTEELENRFTYHPPKPGQVEAYQELRDKARELAELFAQACPESREQALAHTNLEQAVFWANAAIARRSPTAKPQP
jgi:hypothetical protein